MVPCLVEVLIVLVIVCQTQQVPFTERQVFEFVFEDDSCMEQSVFYDVVTL